MSSPVVTRHFITLQDGRQLHYRRAGAGPPVLLLHQSPASSAELLPLIVELSGLYTVFAPDTPGNGLSPTLHIAHPRIDDFANNVIEFMDALSIDRAAVYGFHTGAAIAMALSHRHADRISVAVANGYTQMQPDELADILRHYLPPLTVEWNGGHLLWAWSRIRDQYIFFPWYARRPASRSASGMPATRALHDAVMDLLRAGDGYAQAYRAAFEYDRAAVVGSLQAPTVIMTARTDALYRYLDVMPTPSAAVSVHRPATHEEARRILRETLALQGGSSAIIAAPPSARPVAGEIWCDYLLTPAGSLFALRSTEGMGRPLLFCHDSAGSALGLRPQMLPWLGQRPLLAVDLPGNGESDRIAGVAISVAQQAACLAAALQVAGYDNVDVLACGGGATVACELALQQPELVHTLRVTEQPPKIFGAAIELDEYGLHLLRVWNMVRDQQLYAPWQQRSRANVLIPAAEALDAGALHRQTLDVLKCLESLPQIEAAHAGYPLAATLRTLGSKLQT